jgi:anti-sigma B factor antagonist
MKVEDHLDQDVAVVALDGSLDSRSAPDVQNRLEQVLREQGLVLLDLSRTSYLSSAGLRVLLLLFRQAERDGARIVLAGVPTQVWEVLSATGFVDVFTVTDTVGDGMRVLRK